MALWSLFVLRGLNNGKSCHISRSSEEVGICKESEKIRKNSAVIFNGHQGC